MVNMLQGEVLVVGGIALGFNFFLAAIVTITFFNRHRLTRIVVRQINKTSNNYKRS